MFIRVVRFTGVDSERMDGLSQRVDENEGPPEGVPSTGIKILHDADQGTAVVLQYFDSKEDLEKGAEVLEQMDPSDTPGTRASVDACEVKLELSA
jgi:hypothetical protein